MIRPVVIMLVGVLTLPVVGAKEWFLECPNEVAGGSINVQLSSGWNVYNPDRLRLRSAAFMGGAPDKMMYLVPYQVSRKAGIQLERWKFDGGEVWLKCAYGDAGQITLSKAIDGQPEECTVKYAGDTISKIACLDQNHPDNH
jgi:hypothetical protein